MVGTCVLPQSPAVPRGASMLHLRELQVLCRVCLVERDRGLWENWLIAKTAFPSPRCDVPHAPLVGAARSRISFGF